MMVNRIAWVLGVVFVCSSSAWAAPKLNITKWELAKLTYCSKVAAKKCGPAKVGSMMQCTAQRGKRNKKIKGQEEACKKPYGSARNMCARTAQFCMRSKPVHECLKASKACSAAATKRYDNCMKPVKKKKKLGKKLFKSCKSTASTKYQSCVKNRKERCKVRSKRYDKTRKLPPIY